MKSYLFAAAFALLTVAHAEDAMSQGKDGAGKQTDVMQGNAMQSSAMHSNAMQGSAMQGGAMHSAMHAKAKHKKNAMQGAMSGTNDSAMAGHH